MNEDKGSCWMVCAIIPNTFGVQCELRCRVGLRMPREAQIRGVPDHMTISAMVPVPCNRAQ